MAEVTTTRIAPEHAEELIRFFGNYYEEEHFLMEYVSNDSHIHLTTSPRIQDLVHAFIRGRESLREVIALSRRN